MPQTARRDACAPRPSRTQAVLRTDTGSEDLLFKTGSVGWFQFAFFAGTHGFTHGLFPAFGKLALVPHEETGDGKDAGGEAANAPEDLHRQTAKCAVVQGGEAVQYLSPSSPLAHIGEVLELTRLGIECGDAPIVAPEGAVGRQLAVGNKVVLLSGRQGDIAGDVVGGFGFRLGLLLQRFGFLVRLGLGFLLCRHSLCLQIRIDCTLM